MNIVQEVQRETATKLLGIELKYLVKGLQFHLEQCQKEDDITGIFRFELDKGHAQQILEKFCTIFPEHAPEL